MQKDRLFEIDNREFDVVICGGGLAGLTLARQLRREHPEMSVLLIEKTSRPLPEACHKVGESSVELGSQYLERLGLREYLVENHLFKYGLRFFPGGGELPLEERLELGPMQDPIVPSYQLDRGILETDLRGFVEADGVTLLEGCAVREIDVQPGTASHRITFEPTQAENGPSRTVSARWVVDATGRNAHLRKRMKLTRGAGHGACAGWYRVKGRVDINTFVPESNRAWHDPPYAKQRWRSTNHLMGTGYWVWIIPLSSGNTSIGVVVHDENHSFDDVRSLERCQAFIAKHEPVLDKHLQGFEVLDFLCLNHYSHSVGRGWSPDRWALVGEAGAFVDPLYSPGTDFIAYANTFTSELIRVDKEGGDLESRTRDLNLQYRALVSGNLDVYRIAAPVYGHPRAMLAKVYWDNLAYWSYSCQYFLQGIYRISGEQSEHFIDIGRRFIEMSQRMQLLFREWALLAPEKPVGGFVGMPRFPSILVDAHIDLQKKMSPDETLEYMQMRLAQAEEVAAEMVFRVVAELGDETATTLAERTGLAKWDFKIPRSRIEEEHTIGLGRRRALTRLARDVERGLGRITARTSDKTLASLLAPLLVDIDPELLQSADA